jgi:lipopolysaccharide export system permease protein
LILDHYLLRQVLGPFVLGVALLCVVFAAFAGSNVLADAAAGSLAPSVVWKLIALKLLVAGEVIVPSALFFAVLFVFERLSRDRELVAMMAGGVAGLRLLLPLALAGAIAAVLVALLSLELRPWAYRTSYLLEDLATRPDVSTMRAGRFYALGPQLVVTANGVDGEGRTLQDVFARQQEGEALQLIRAEAAHLAPPDDDGVQIVEFRRGEMLTLRDGLQQGDRRQRFESLTYRWRYGAVLGRPDHRRAQATAALQPSPAPKDRAEFQWRVTMPVLAFAMTVLAAALGAFLPLAGRWRMAAAVGLYMAVFYLAAAAQTALENGSLAAFPGLYGLPLLPLLAAVVVAFLGRRLA